MKQFRANSFANLSAITGSIERIQAAPGEMYVWSQTIHPETVAAIRDTLAHMQEIGLPASAASLERILRLITEGREQSVADLIRQFTDLRSRLQDEMSGRLFFSIEADQQRFWIDAHPFGEAVSEKFPSAITDVQESGKCIGTNRATAAVFHLMRVMEHGLRAVGKSLNDPSIDPDRNPTWNTLLTRFDGELKKNLASRSPEWHTDEEFFSGVAARLHAVKDAWRNPTMHVRSAYSIEEATDIYANVRGFMQHIARKLAE